MRVRWVKNIIITNNNMVSCAAHGVQMNETWHTNIFWCLYFVAFVAYCSLRKQK